MPRFYPSLDPSAIRARERALDRFSRWQATMPARYSPEVALSGVAMLFERLPASSRVRPIDVSGVAALHQALSVLDRARR